MRQKMKEEFKQDLRKRKEFLDSVKEFKRTKKLSDAVVEIQNATEDDTDVWIEKVNQESALSEAKMEMALDSTNVTPPSPQPQITAATEAEMRKIQAQELVRQMKAEMEAANTPKTPPAPQVQPETPVDTTQVNPPVPPDDRPPRKLMDGI